MIRTVNRILFRRSGTLNMFFRLESIGSLLIRSATLRRYGG
jgi:hypothetical protein